MATVIPPPSKRQKVAAEVAKQDREEQQRIPEGLGNVRVQFVDQSTGTQTGAPVSVPVAQASVKNLELLLNSLKGQGDGHVDDRIPYQFAFQPDSASAGNAFDIYSDLYNTVLKPLFKSTEDVITLQYTPQNVFRVRAITRCSASIAGHGQAILTTQFSPAGSSRMVSGSGDSTARIWDCETGTPLHTLKGHTSWVLAVSYSPDGSTLATGSMDNTIRLWDVATGKLLREPLRGHSKWITALAWEPYHLQAPGRPRLASSSKDGTVRIWDATRGSTDLLLSRHKGSVSCVKWGGTGNIYSSSHDKTINIYNSTTGAIIKTLTSHAHWVNHLALSTDHVLRTAYHSPIASEALPSSASDKAKRALALSRFEKAAKISGVITERFVSASDDCTIFLWDSNNLSKPIARLLGHQKQVNHVSFSPSGAMIASTGFDNHVKLWSARDGTFLHTLRGHVAPVYMCAFSADSRLCVSASKDGTLKAWDLRSGKLVEDLPGHGDEVFAVDWSADGKRVGSGGKDRAVRIWTH